MFHLGFCQSVFPGISWGVLPLVYHLGVSWGVLPLVYLLGDSWGVLSLVISPWSFLGCVAPGVSPWIFLGCVTLTIAPWSSTKHFSQCFTIEMSFHSCSTSTVPTNAFHFIDSLQSCVFYCNFLSNKSFCPASNNKKTLGTRMQSLYGIVFTMVQMVIYSGVIDVHKVLSLFVLFFFVLANEG